MSVNRQLYRPTLALMFEFTRRAVLASLLCAAVLSPAGPARADRDHDRARLAVERGEALPLADILAKAGPKLGGEVVGVSFEWKSDRWIYEFRIVAPGGRLFEVHVDASTAQILKSESQ
jgi:uncharacterized membrane protein YkoI